MAKIEEITDMEELDQLFHNSGNRPVFIFKHSEICPVSIKALNEYRSFVEEGKDDYTYALIMIRDHRNLSDEVVKRTGISHESPQALLVINSQAVWDDSHYEITQDKLKQVVMMYADKAFAD